MWLGSSQHQDRWRSGCCSGHLALAGQFAEVWPLLWGVSDQQSVGANRFTVFLGRQDQAGSNPNELSRTISRIVCHPDYSGSTNDNDICLLELSSAVTFTDYIAPVCLAADGSNFNSGIINWVTGWGTTSRVSFLPFIGSAANILQEVDLPIVGNRECDCSYGRITNNMICAGLSAGGKDSCQGDSGGPLVGKQGVQWVQSGVVSFGRGCASPNFPGVYARVSEYQAWINGIITTNQPGFVDFRSAGINSDATFNCGDPPSGPVTASPTAPAHLVLSVEVSLRQDTSP
uniref:Peptidase S1 domain-containing protein n=1 Tax=Gadus morhua TaxID=8049 RepID=A0A8C5CBC7_GADMO